MSQQSVLIKNDLDGQSHRQIVVLPTEMIWLVILICYSDRLQLKKDNQITFKGIE